MQKLISVEIGSEAYNTRLRLVFEQYERGEISDETLIWNFQQFNSTLNPRLFVEAWNSMLVGMHPNVLDLLKKLKDTYNLTLLSNINGFHARYISRYLKAEYGLTDFLTQYFDQYFYSHEIGMRKPEHRIYQHVSDCLAVDELSNILFIDDNLENVTAAISYGWTAVHHDPSIPIDQAIDTYLT